MNEEREQRYFKGLSRKEYILKTHEIIGKQGVEAVSIRSIAKELGCSSASLYRYFDSRDELIYYAGLKTLTSYIVSLNEAEPTWETIWDIYVGIWDCYALEAFKYPEIYNLLFFTFTNEKLSPSIKEYYSMFPEDIQDTNKFFHEMLKTPDFLGRDMVVCRRCVREGALPEEYAVQLNRMSCMLFKGYFKTIMDEGIAEDEIEARVDSFVQDLDAVVKALACDLKGYEGYHRRYGKWK